MVRSIFDKQLIQLNDEIILMGQAITERISSAIQALFQKDVVMAKRIAESDEMVDQYQKRIENICFTLLIQQQPVAKDLRTVTAAMNMITDMERIGDHAVDISELTIMMDQNSKVDQFVHVKQMAGETLMMLNEAMNSFVNKDEQKAQKVIAADDIVDRLFIQVKEEIVEFILVDSKEGQETIDLVLIAKYFERIADHATNIAEWVIYQKQKKESTIEM